MKKRERKKEKKQHNFWSEEAAFLCGQGQVNSSWASASKPLQKHITQSQQQAAVH